MKMHGTGWEGMFMEKFAGLVAGLTLASGLVFGQTVNIQQWHGTLVDAGCAGSSAAKTADSASAPAAEEGQTAGQAVDTGRPRKGHAKAEAPASGCTLSNSTSAFALQATGGQVFKFDSVGNIRATEMLKSKANWTKDLTAGKPIHAKVSGTLSGDTITVASLQ